LYPDIEDKLINFKLLKPSEGLRLRLLTTAQARQSEGSEISATFKLGIKIYFTAAAFILIFIMLFNFLTYDAPKLDIRPREHDIEQALELGFPKDSAVYTVAILRSKPKFILTPRLLIQGPLL
jgi:hypothetical protein